MASYISNEVSNNNKSTNGKIVNNASLEDNCYFMEADAVIGKFEEVGEERTNENLENEIKIEEEDIDITHEDFLSGQYNFECSLCMFTTSDEMVLKGHMLEHINGPDLDTFVEESHNGENYTCLFCPFSSVSSEMLKYHIRFKHSCSTSNDFPSNTTVCPTNISPRDITNSSPTINPKGTRKNSTSKHSSKERVRNKSANVKNEFHNAITNMNISTDKDDTGSDRDTSAEKLKSMKRKRIEKKKFNLVEEQYTGTSASVPVDGSRKCRKCNFHCSENFVLTEHYNEFHPELLSYCQQCTYMTPYYSTFQRHLESHRKDILAGIAINPIYQPKIKRKCFPTPSVKLPPPPPIVPVPKKPARRSVTETKKVIKSPVVKVSPPKTYQCDRCNFQTSSRNHYVRHERIHTGEKPFSCPHCDYCCNQGSTMKIHIRRHTGEKPFACGLCPFRTHSHGDLTTHIKKHERMEESFFCDVCHQIFFSSKAVNRHRQVHEEDIDGRIKPVKVVPRKNDAITSPSPLKRKKHPSKQVGKNKKNKVELSTYRCSTCNFTCDKFISLSEHSITHKGNTNVEHTKPKYQKYSCKICLIFFDSRKDKKRHKKAFHKADVESNINMRVNVLNDDSD